MLSDEEFHQKISETLRQSNELIGDAESRLEEMKRLLEKHNLPENFGEMILNSQYVTKDQKQKADEEIEAFQEELQRDLRDAEDLAKSQRRKVKMPRRGLRI